MICENCHKENRSIAKFCKWCGQPLVAKNVLDKLVGLTDVKTQLKTIVDTYTYLRSRKDIATIRLSVNAIITRIGLSTSPSLRWLMLWTISVLWTSGRKM